MQPAGGDIFLFREISPVFALDSLGLTICSGLKSLAGLVTGVGLYQFSSAQ